MGNDIIRTKRKKAKHKMVGYNPTKPIIICGVLVCLCLSGVIFWNGTYRRSSYDNIQYIKSFMSSSGEIRDISNKINMKNPKTDIQWFDEDGIVTIHFGRIVMEWERDEFLSETVQKELNVIGFSVKQENKDPDTVIRLFYQGLELPEMTH